MIFWCRYWSRDRSRDHFGLENGLETSLVTLGSVTFWSQNGLETGSRPFWSRKWSRDLVSSLSGTKAMVTDVLGVLGEDYSHDFLFHSFTETSLSMTMPLESTGPM